MAAGLWHFCKVPCVVALLLMAVLAPCGGKAPLDSDATSVVDASVSDSAPSTLADLPVEDPPESFEDFIEWHMARAGIPGLAVGMVASSEVTYARGFGWANIEAEIPVDEHTLFPVASVSKLFTVVPLMRLMEEDRLDLDQTTGEAFGLPIVHPMFPETPITTRQLLTHTSGLIDAWITLGRTTYGPMDEPITLEEFALGYTQPGGAYYSESNFGPAPGTDWEYCNAAFAVAGHLAERGWGTGFGDLTRRQVFEPLALEETTWDPTDARGVVATAYAYDMRRGTHSPVSHPSYAHFPAGGLFSSLHDLLRFARAWLGDGQLEGVRFLEADTVQTMMALQVPELSGRQGIALRYDVINDRAFIGHSGAGLAASANFLLLPAEGAALVLVSSSDAYVRARLGMTEGRDALDAILSRMEQELSLQL